MSAPPIRPEASTPAVPEAPDDAGDLRGRYFGEIAANRFSIGVLIALMLVTVVLLIRASANGAGAAVLLILVFAGWLIVNWLIARHRSEDAFFAIYAEQRGLTRSKDKQVRPWTPLLRAYEGRFIEHAMDGELPGGLEGRIAFLTVQKDSLVSDHTEWLRFTIVIAKIAGTPPGITQLYCERRSGPGFLDRTEDIFRRTKRVEQESTEFDRRYEVFANPDADDLMVRRLLSPSFISWLAEDAQAGIAFECEGRTLCVNVEGHHKSSEKIDEICASAARIAAGVNRPRKARTGEKPG